jgi:hypothetical protein
LDIPNPDLNTSASARHAYHTADYKVTKREMAALWNRYYVWKAAKEKDLKRESSSVTTIGPGARGSRRAYQTASFDSFSVPVQQAPSHAAARHAYRPLPHHTVVRPARAAYATHSIHLTVI